MVLFNYSIRYPSITFVKRLNFFLLTLILIISGIAFWQPAYAQSGTDVEIDALEISLFPEFNRPSMLVVYEITLENAISLPARLTFQIPIDGQLLAVSNRESDDSLTALETETSEFGQWKDVRFSSNTHQIRIEYYDPNLIKQGDQRIFVYEWLSIYPVGTLTVNVRQPLGASQVYTVPSLGEPITDADNNVIFSKELDGVPSGEPFSLRLIYTKDAANPAFPALDVDPAIEVNPTTQGRTPSPLTVVMWLLTFDVGVLVMLGLYYWWYARNISNKSERMVQGVGIANPEKEVVFCHECGMRSHPGDSYCSNCGTELRRPSRSNATTTTQPRINHPLQ